MRALAYEQVKRRILTMDLAPSQRIDENRIASEVGASRTPVREALHQLAAEGLILIVARGGYVVADVNLPRFRELIEAEHIVARAVTHLLVARVDDAGLAQLERAIQAVDVAQEARDAAQVAETNTQLHILEARLTDNSYLLSMAERVYTHLQRFAYVSFGGAGGVDDVGVPAGSGADRDALVCGSVALGGGAVPDDDAVPDDGAVTRDADGLAEHYATVHEDHWAYFEALHNRDVATAEAVAVRHVELFRARVQQYLGANAIGALDFSGIAEQNGGSGEVAGVGH